MSTARTWRETPQRYRLEAVKSKKTGNVYYPPRIVGEDFKDRDFEIVNLPRKGKIVTFTVIRVASSQFTDQAPYAVGVVELENETKTRLMLQITDCPVDDISIGMPVRLEFRKIHSDGKHGIIAYGHKAVPA